MQKMILTAVVLFGLTILTLRAPHAQEDKPLAPEKESNEGCAQGERRAKPADNSDRSASGKIAVGTVDEED